MKVFRGRIEVFPDCSEVMRPRKPRLRPAKPPFATKNLIGEAEYLHSATDHLDAMPQNLPCATPYPARVALPCDFLLHNLRP